MKILVIDDDAIFLDLVKEWLQGKNHQVQAVSSVAEAQVQLLQMQTDLVITDYHLQEEKGTEVITFIKTSDRLKEIPIIIMSGLFKNDLTINYHNISFISKPFAQQDLLSLIDEAVKKSDSKRAAAHLDPRIFEQYVHTTKEILSHFIKGKVEYGKPEKSETRGNIYGDISSCASILCDKFRGNIILSFDKECIFHIASQMLFRSFIEINDEITDLAAELMNMVAGNAKAKLPDINFIHISSPVVIHGSDYKIQYLDGSFCAHVPFKTAHGNFHLDIRVLRPLQALQREEEGIKS